MELLLWFGQVSPHISTQDPLYVFNMVFQELFCWACIDCDYKSVGCYSFYDRVYDYMRISAIGASNLNSNQAVKASGLSWFGLEDC